MTHSQNKGKRAERKAAKLLQEATEEKWQRVPQSGATATAQGVESHVFKGDVFNEESYKDLCVEVKDNIDTFRLYYLFHNSTFEKNLKQAKEESNGEDYILMQRLYGSWLILFPQENERFQSSSVEILYVQFLDFMLSEDRKAAKFSIDGYKCVWYKG
jgi:Holliday junction resolvase